VPRTQALVVWSGHSCPLPLTLVLGLIFRNKIKITRKITPRSRAADKRIRPTPSNRQQPTTGRLVLNFLFTKNAFIMLFSKEYVGYLAREVSKKLVASGLIETQAMPALNEKVHAALLEELALEDRINDEVRVILEAYSEEMQKSGANYQEMFRKVKTELVKKYKAVL
jgi:hypothetical protein